MKTIATLLITASLAVVLTGCTAYRHNKAGDAAASTGDMRSAVYHYERALVHKEKYTRDTDFLTKLATARSRVAYDDAAQLRAEGRYEPALDQLRESIRQDTAYAEPAALLPDPSSNLRVTDVCGNAPPNFRMFTAAATVEQQYSGE